MTDTKYYKQLEMEDLQSKIEFPSKHDVYRVKKAIELATGREVAIKILRFDQQTNEESGSRRGEILESFFQEVSILSNCDHPNIVKILQASFDGTLIKEAVSTITTTVKSVAHYSEEDRDQVIDTTSKDIE